MEIASMKKVLSNYIFVQKNNMTKDILYSEI